jgi:hypothetical protein
LLERAAASKDLACRNLAQLQAKGGCG